MEANRFDSISKLFANRRFSRRQALAQGGAGLAAAGIATAGLSAVGRSSASAQDAVATPVAAADKTMFLFLQSFESATIVPKDDAADTYTLTLEHGLGQTIYFSDRPERIVGATPTPQFLEGLGFPDDNPPNAALLVNGEDGHTDIVVLELFAPQYDDTSHTATYDVKLLERWEQTLAIAFTEVPLTKVDEIPGAGGAHLFIDDCSSRGIYCRQGLNGPGVGESFGVQGFCYWWRYASCWPCEPENAADKDEIFAYWGQKCDETYPTECADGCTPLYAGPDICSGNNCE